MPVQYTFGQSFVAGLQYGLDRKERAERIQHQYALEQQRQAYQQQVLALQTRQEDRLQSESDRRAQEAEDSKVAVPTGEMRAIGGGVPGLAPVVERVPLSVAKYMSDQRQLAEARNQLEALGQARGEILGIDPETAGLLSPSDISYLSQQRGDASQAEENRLNRETQIRVANIYTAARGGGGGSAGASTKFERLRSEIGSLPQQDRLPFILSEIQKLEDLEIDGNPTAADREYGVHLRLLKTQLQSGGGQQQAEPPAAVPGTSPMMGGQGEFMRRIIEQGARQGAAVAPLASPGVPASEPQYNPYYQRLTPEQARSLPPGTWFTDVDGNPRQRK